MDTALVSESTEFEARIFTTGTNSLVSPVAITFVGVITISVLILAPLLIGILYSGGVTNLLQRRGDILSFFVPRTTKNQINRRNHRKIKNFIFDKLYL